MPVDKKEFISTLTQVMDVNVKPFIRDLVKEEVRLQVHAQLMDLIHDEAGNIIADEIRKAVKRQIIVEVGVKRD